MAYLPRAIADSLLLLALVLAVTRCQAPNAQAAMESTNYRIESDAVNVGGVESGQSANFQLQETTGEQGSGFLESGSFQVSGGYRGFVGATPTPQPASAAAAAGSAAGEGAGGGAFLSGRDAASFNATFGVRYLGDTSALISWEGSRENTATLFYGLARDALNQRVESLPFSHTHTLALDNLAPQTTYFFKITSADRFGNRLETTIFSMTTARDETPPANVRAFAALAGDRLVTLSWRNPPDADFTGVRIRRSAAGYPKAPRDGEPVYDGREERFTDDNVLNDTTYYYTAFSYDANGNFSSGTLAHATPSRLPAPRPGTPPAPTFLPSAPAPSPQQGGPSIPGPGTVPERHRVRPTPAPPMPPGEKLTLADVTFEAKTDFGYLPLEPSQERNFDILILQNLRISIPKTKFARTPSELVLAINQEQHLLRLNGRIGIHETEITAPAQQGNFPFLLTIRYPDGSQHDIQGTVTAYPHGSVRQEVRGQAVPIPMARVTLEICGDSAKATCSPWPGALFRQRNPQFTDAEGRYAFLAPAGVYRLTAEKTGWRSYRERLQTTNMIVNPNILLHPRSALDALVGAIRAQALAWQGFLAALALLTIALITLRAKKGTGP